MSLPARSARPISRVLPYINYPSAIPHYVPLPLRASPTSLLSALQDGQKSGNADLNRLIEFTRSHRLIPPPASDDPNSEASPDEVLVATVAQIWGVPDFEKMSYSPRPWSGQRGDKMQVRKGGWGWMARMQAARDTSTHSLTQSSQRRVALFALASLISPQWMGMYWNIIYKLCEPKHNSSLSTRPSPLGYSDTALSLYSSLLQFTNGTSLEPLGVYAPHSRLFDEGGVPSWWVNVGMDGGRLTGGKRGWKCAGWGTGFYRGDKRTRDDLRIADEGLLKVRIDKNEGCTATMALRQMGTGGALTHPLTQPFCARRTHRTRRRTSSCFLPSLGTTTI